LRRAELEASPGWWPLSIQVHRLSLQDVEVFSRTARATAQSTGDGTDIRSMLEGLGLPLPLEIDDAVLTNIIFQQDDQPPLAPVESVRFQAALDERLVVEYLDIMATGLETRMQGYLKLEPPFELAANMQGRIEITGETGEQPFSMPFKLEGAGDLDKIQFSVTSLENGLQLGGEILDPVLNPGWDARMVLDRLSWPQGPAEQVITLSDLSLVSQGNFNDWSFVLDSRLRADALDDARLVVSGSGSLTGIQIDNAALTGPGMDLGFSGKLDWLPQPEAGLKIVVRQLDLSPWLSDWPAGEQLAGDLELSWSPAGLQIPVSQLTVSGTGLLVRIAADYDIEANRVEASLDWNNLNWPLTAATAGFTSESGQLSINGSADDWVASGRLNIKVGDYPQGRFEVQGGGDRTSAHLVIPAGEILGGQLSGEAGADWSDVLNWNAVIKAHGINPEPLLPGWPGKLDSEFEISAQGLPQQIRINLVSLQGMLRGVVISASGGLNVMDSGLTFNHLEVNTDEAVLTLNGAMAEPAGVTARFSGNLPSSLLQGTRGSLELEGRYSSFARQPLLEVQLQALDLAWDKLSIGKLVVSTPELRAPGPVPAFQLNASELAWNDQLFEHLSLSLNPVGEQFELKANLAGEKIVMTSVMSLTPGNMKKRLSETWQGVLTELDVEVGQAYSFELSKPAAFTWSTGSASMGPVCLSENDGASLCADLDYQNNGDWSLIADATAVPLNYLRDILELDVNFEQLLEGRMEWHHSHDKAPTGGADFRITAGRILDLLDDEVLAESNEGRFAFNLQNGNLEAGVLDIEFPGTGFIDVNFNVLDIVGEASPKVQGSAVARFNHLKLAGQLALPGLDTVDGQFETSIQLGGSLANPDFEGGFKFSNGFIHYAPIGLELEDIEIEGQVKRRDSGDFKGRFRAGDGMASLDGRFVFDDIGTAKLEVDLAGESLLLINTDSLKVLTETKLKIAISPQRVDINGQITVPSARLTAANLLLEEVRDSEDLVITAQDIEAESDVSESPAKTQVYGQLEVTFGDDVFIKVPDVETYIKGSTLFTWSGEQVPMAQGAYTLKGKVDVYGPTLKIDNGSISFPGVPADNPLLHIRAGREIFGNTQIRSAGVQVIGSLKKPVLEAYTVPLTNEDRAWTLLVTGSDFDQSQGVSGFDVGTYIAPKLYVSYGISLFDNQNVISARYDLKKGFGVKVTSGQRETGLDVSYTIDR
jgi:translocation and assembly module TamB